MTDPWTPERVVDAALAGDLVASSFRDLAPVRVEPLGVGWDNTVFLVNDAWVFRFPRRQIVVSMLEREARVLPVLAPRLPLAVPVPERLGVPGERFPWPFVGHRIVRGRTACAAALDDDARTAAAEPLGRFLAALHSFPVDDAVQLGAGPDPLARTDVSARTVKVRKSLADLRARGLADDPVERAVEDAIAALEAETGAARPPPVLVHGDLYARHVVVDAAGAPTGVIDWGDLHVGDPAVDLGLAYSFFPPSARAAFRAAYGAVDGRTWDLSRFRALYHSATVLVYAHDVGDAVLVRESRLALDLATR